jgi:hypothetical protein
VELAFVREDHVDARERVAAEQPVDRYGQLLRARRDLVWEVGRAHVVGLADLVARLEVEEVLLLWQRLYDRQCLDLAASLEQADRELPSLYVALQQDLVVVAESCHQRFGHVGGGAGELDS